MHSTSPFPQVDPSTHMALSNLCAHLHAGGNF